MLLSRTAIPSSASVYRSVDALSLNPTPLTQDKRRQEILWPQVVGS